MARALGWPVRRVLAELSAAEYAGWLGHLRRYPADNGTQIVLMQIFYAFMQFAGSKNTDMYAVAPWLRPPETAADRRAAVRRQSAFQRRLALAAVQASRPAAT